MLRLRVVTAYLSLAGWVLAGCGDSPDSAVLAPENPLPPCSTVPGLLYAEFAEHVSLGEADRFLLDLGFPHEYQSAGNAFVESDIVSGDVEDLETSLSQNVTVERVTFVTGSFPEHRRFFVTTFVAGVDPESAVRLIETYPELRVTESGRRSILAAIEVPIGEENQWVEILLSDDLVEWAYPAPTACP
jgi:hypothetical protein